MQPLVLLLSALLVPLIFQTSIFYNYYYDCVQEYFQPEVESEIYDFIVVGSGSSGAVVAYRLSQHYKVLLIEAGGDPSILSSIPAFAFDLLGRSEHDWNYKSVKRENLALSHTNQEILHNRGKVLGGCSTLNYMLYLRGHPLDYDNWANITGDPNWNYENLLPFFKKSVKEYKGAFQNNKKHYESSPYGFLTIEKVKWDQMQENFLGAGADLGLNTNIDANGPQVSGVGTFEVTQRNGARHSTFGGLLKPSSSNRNLRISKYSQATKIKFDKSGKAIGVWYYKHGKKHFAKASKEIISSAGAYDSPKLLMLSGIGPKAELEAIGIRSKVDLPVGKNLQDHFGVFLWGFTAKSLSSVVMERDIGFWDFYEYFTKGTGFFTVPNGLNGQFFHSTTDAKAMDWPDIQTFFSAVSGSEALVEAAANVFSIKKEILKEMMMPTPERDGFGVISFLNRPKSVGQVTLRNKNPFADPLIDSNPFSHPDDMRAMIEGINASLSLIENSESFAKVEAKFNDQPFSKCAMHLFRSNAYWECYTRHTLYSVWHPVGTCKMSHQGDPTAVVDPQLRVLGTRGLRVIDASIMPEIVNANTNAPSILIGERGADFILEYWSNQYLISHYLQPLRYDYLNMCFYSRAI